MSTADFDVGASMEALMRILRRRAATPAEQAEVEWWAARLQELGAERASQVVASAEPASTQEAAA